MKITNTTPSYINQTYAKQADKSVANQNLKTTETATNEPLTDSINLSDRTKDLQKISKALDTEPADRKKQVEDIKLQVKSNQYDINAETIAEKMIGSHMNELV